MATVEELSPQSWQRDGYVISTARARLQLDVVHDYLARHSYWAQNRPRATLERAIVHSRCYGVYQADGVQVGFGRCVTDFAVYAYLADVFILTAKQGQGLGKWLISCILADPQLSLVRRWTLYTNDAQSLYARFGFEVEPEPTKHMVLRRAVLAEPAEN